jgi:hypothetical protein
LAIDRGINDGVAPQSEPDARILLDDFGQFLTRSAGNTTAICGCHPKIHPIRMERPQIAEVTGDKECRDLAASVGQQRVTAGETVDDHTDLGRAASL